VFVSVITVSELLTGVHRADSEVRRARRSAFVEAIIGGITALDFTTEIARVHAELWSDLAVRGRPIGAHDLIIAATAVAYDLSLLTDNVDEFTRIPALNVVNFS
jgi:tRNA(fMet)-specific endonuclease VapC